MPSPLVPVQYRPPFQTEYARPVVGFDAPSPCCGRVVPWTATPADGATPHCGCEQEGAA